MNKTERTLHCWDHLETQLEKLSDLMRESPRAGATDAEIAAAEEKLGLPLPAELKALYRLHDGQRLCCPETRRAAFLFFHRDHFRWLPVKEVAATFKEMPLRRPDLLPIAAAGNGDPLCVSLESGEVVLDSHDEEDLEPVADSFADLLCGHARDLEEGYLVEARPGVLDVPEVAPEELEQHLAELFAASPESEADAILRAVAERVRVRPRWVDWRYGHLLRPRQWKKLRQRHGLE